MNRTRLPEEALAGLSVESVRVYLRSQGWSMGRELPRVEIWSTEIEGEAADVLLPKDPRLVDFVRQLHFLFSTLGQLEERDPAEILRDVTTPQLDRYYAHLFPTGLPSGTVSLPEGTRAFAGFRDLFLSSTYRAMAGMDGREPGPVEPARKSNEVYEFLSRVRLGLTGAGSYILVAELPLRSLVPEQLRLDILGRFGQMPLSRRVSLALYDGVSVALTAARRSMADRGSLDAFEEYAPLGLTANVCESLTELSSAGRVPFQLRVAWASDLEVDRPAAPLQFDAPVIETLQQGAEFLRRRFGRQKVTLRGFVTQIERAPTSGPGTVVVLGGLDDEPRGRAIKVHVDLNTEPYEQAGAAHLARQEVSVRGDLQRDGNRWRLVRVEGLTVEDPTGN